MNALLQLIAPWKALKIPHGFFLRFAPGFLTYSPTHIISFETQKYHLKIATKMSELLEVFRLRYQIFLEDCQGVGDGSEIDVDDFDTKCDHIIIEDKENSKIVGTYRVLSSDWSDHFYSEGEFDLENFLKSPGIKLELGRACIHHGHRNGAVIDLLWKGIGEYAKRTRATQLFGCSSVKTTSKDVSEKLMNYLAKRGMLENNYGVIPRSRHNMGLKLFNECFSEDEAKSYLPSLLRSYLSAGARVHGAPALDKDFGCIDFLTIIDINALNPSYRKRYFDRNI
jgi:putative hemolysin